MIKLRQKSCKNIQSQDIVSVEQSYSTFHQLKSGNKRFQKINFLISSFYSNHFFPVFQPYNNLEWATNQLIWFSRNAILHVCKFGMFLKKKSCGSRHHSWITHFHEVQNKSENLLMPKSINWGNKSRESEEEAGKKNQGQFSKGKTNGKSKKLVSCFWQAIKFQFSSIAIFNQSRDLLNSQGASFIQESVTQVQSKPRIQSRETDANHAKSRYWNQSNFRFL